MSPVPYCIAVPRHTKAMTGFDIKDYFAAVGSKFTQEDAEIIGPELSELALRGTYTAQDVADVARSTNSPLHKYFEWDNDKAANLYRVGQARTMMAQIKVRVVHDDGTERIDRAVAVMRPKREAKADALKAALRVVTGDKAVAIHMMRNAIKELSHWRERYETHQSTWETLGTAFVGIFNTIGEMEEAGIDANALLTGTDDVLQAVVSACDQNRDAFDAWRLGMEHLRFMHEAIVEAERAFDFIERKHNRKCMKCSTEFISSGPGHRMCDRCRDATEVDAYV